MEIFKSKDSKKKQWHIFDGYGYQNMPRPICNVAYWKEQEVEFKSLNEKNKELCPSCVLQAYKRGKIDVISKEEK